MREIKFRAWDKKNKWITSVVCLNMGTWIDVILVHPNPLGVREGEQVTYNQKTGQVKLMQFTGLTDNNGTEIYEGDIITCQVGNDYCRGVVTWMKESADYDILSSDGQFFLAFGITDSEYEVIGNIYESPELLKDSEEENEQYTS